MTNEEISNCKREEEQYYLNKEWEIPGRDKEAQRRYDTYVSKDPFPEVASALLNSADIFKYVVKTGMIFPFHTEKLMGASYEVAIRGKVIWWEDDGKDGEEQKHEKNLLSPGDFFELKPNSIAYLTLEPMFRIPDYIALRFNLRIVHVYKGLLLGTGPLVDPGFVGRLSIPLHNLTANTYIFRAGDGLIQIEFTKLSKNERWLMQKNGTDGLYKRNWITPNRTLETYLERSLQGSGNKSIKSSLPESILRFQKKVDKSEKDVNDLRYKVEKDVNVLSDKVEKEVTITKDKVEKTVNKLQEKIQIRMNTIQIVSVITIIPVFAFALTAIYQLGSANTVKKEQIFNLQTEYEQLSQDYNALRLEFKNTEDKLSKQIEKLERQLQESLNEKDEVEDEKKN